MPLAGQEIVLFPRASGGKMFEMLTLLAFTTLMTVLTSGGWIAGMLGMMGLYTSGAELAASAALISGALSIGGAMLISWAFSPGQPSQPAFSTTYDPTGPKGLAQPGVPVPKGYGAFGWCGNIVSSYASFDGQDAYIYALACYGFGHAVSISDVLINGKPISEYANCNYQVRLGTNSQTPIPGFDRTVNGFPQETQMLVSNGPVTVSGTGTDVQGLQVTCKLPSGLYRVTNDGNYIALSVIYTIQYAVHGSGDWKEPLFPQTTEEILVFGGGLVSSPQTLYFTTGLVMENDGLFGTLTPN